MSAGNCGASTIVATLPSFLYNVVTRELINHLSHGNFQTLVSVLENSKEELMYLNRTGDMLVHELDHQLVNSSPIQDQLAALNATYKDILDRLEHEQTKLEQVNYVTVAFLQLFW